MNTEFLSWIEYYKQDPWSSMAANCVLFPESAEETYNVLMQEFWDEYHTRTETLPIISDKKSDEFADLTYQKLSSEMVVVHKNKWGKTGLMSMGQFHDILDKIIDIGLQYKNVPICNDKN